MSFELSAPLRLDGRSKSSTWTARVLSAVAGSVIAGVLIASPAAATSSIPTKALTGVTATSSVNSTSAAKPVPPNTTNSAAAKMSAKGLSWHDRKEKQQIVRAVVTSTGALVAGQSFGAQSASRLALGTYQVCFAVPITNGTYVASIGLPGNIGVPASGEITVVGRFATNNCLFIQTFNSAGMLADRGFHVAVVYSRGQ